MSQLTKCVLFLTLFMFLVSLWHPVRKSHGQNSDQVANSAQEIHPLLIGFAVPRLTLTKLDGHSFDLNAAMAEKPTVLIFYRGGW